ncbi:MAG: glycosyltransferase family 4 protein [Clostridiaceae bacterium]|nr:glycosyltransferase family 4 protein [Clostridiaceae bacterium]
MRIGQFSDTFLPVVDGVGRVVSNYAKYLGQRCEACYVITPLQSGLYRGGLPYDIIDFCGFPLPRARQYHAGVPSIDIHYLRRFARAKMDIVHAHTPFVAGREAYRKARKKGLPTIATFHSKYYDDFYQFSKSNTFANVGSNMVVDFFSKFDQVWAVSKSTADVLREYGFNRPNEIVENGTERKTPDPLAIRAATKHFGLKDNPILLFVGQMNWKKNIRRILESAQVLVRQNYKYQLVLAGQGPSEKEVRELADTLDLGERVIFTGHISDAAKLDGLYARADLLVFPSLYDNAPMVVREAAALNTPSLLIRGSSAAEVVRDGENGLLAEDTTEDVAAKIAWALDHIRQVQAIGQEAGKTIPKYWEAVIDEVLARYEELIRFKARTPKNG